MERPKRSGAPVTCAAVVVFLGLLAFSCCVAAEFKKAKEEDMKLDGNLCSMPRTPAFGLGVTALVCLSIAQVVGTSAIAIRMRSRGKKQIGSAADGTTPAVITLFALSCYRNRIWEQQISYSIIQYLNLMRDAYLGKESATGDNGCLSKGEVKDLLTRVEHFMETQACDTAKTIGVSFDGVDKGLKSSMLLIKRRWLADMARKAKADVAGKFISEES